MQRRPTLLCCGRHKGCGYAFAVVLCLLTFLVYLRSMVAAFHTYLYVESVSKALGTESPYTLRLVFLPFYIGCCLVNTICICGDNDTLICIRRLAPIIGVMAMVIQEVLNAIIWNVQFAHPELSGNSTAMLVSVMVSILPAVAMGVLTPLDSDRRTVGSFTVSYSRARQGTNLPIQIRWDGQGEGPDPQGNDNAQNVRHANGDAEENHNDLPQVDGVDILANLRFQVVGQAPQFVPIAATNSSDVKSTERYSAKQISDTEISATEDDVSVERQTEEEMGQTESVQEQGSVTDPLIPIPRQSGGRNGSERVYTVSPDAPSTQSSNVQRENGSTHSSSGNADHDTESADGSAHSTDDIAHSTDDIAHKANGSANGSVHNTGSTRALKAASGAHGTDDTAHSADGSACYTNGGAGEKTNDSTNGATASLGMGCSKNEGIDSKNGTNGHKTGDTESKTVPVARTT